MNSYDARVRYTRKVIREEFLRLLTKKPVSKITVTEICASSGINRATFYRHYLDIPDLLDKLEQEILNELRREIRERKGKEVGPFILTVLERVRSDSDAYLTLASNKGDPSFSLKVFEICYQEIKPMLEENIPGMTPEKRDQLYRFLSAGSGGILNEWLRSGMKEPAAEIKDFILKACQGAVHAFV